MQASAASRSTGTRERYFTQRIAMESAKQPAPAQPLQHSKGESPDRSAANRPTRGSADLLIAPVLPHRATKECCSNAYLYTTHAHPSLFNMSLRGHTKLGRTPTRGYVWQQLKWFSILKKTVLVQGTLVDLDLLLSFHSGTSRCAASH